MNQALEEAGIERDKIYITNAVKHFKHRELNGKKRSVPPTRGEIKACSPWLNAELALVKAKVLVCLGVSAAKSLLSGEVSLQKLRGRCLEGPKNIRILVTAHPASVFRHKDREERHRAAAQLAEDLQKAWKLAGA